MVIGLDACGSFDADLALPGFEVYSLGAAVVPTNAASEIAEWTREHLADHAVEERGELHAHAMSWDQRLETCEMLRSRGDVFASVITTDTVLLRSDPAVSRHRALQLASAEEGLERATTDAGKQRGERACRLLDGRRFGQSRMGNSEYVRSAMVPLAVIGAIQRAFCFFASDDWRSEMSHLRVVIDKDTPTIVRYVGSALLPTLGGDPRFRLVSPRPWHLPPRHPLIERARHPDGEGLMPQEIVDGEIDWPNSHEEPAIQVADVAAWVVARTISRPAESVARECFELLRPVLVGEAGRCFEQFSIGRIRPDEEAMYAHLHSDQQPAQWLRPVGIA